MTVYTDGRIGEVRDDFSNDFVDLAHEFAAISIAESEIDRATTFSRFETLQSVFRVIAKAVEKMFRIVDDLASVICEETDRIFNHSEIFFSSSAKYLSDM